jgi:CRP-like cAMP-binding protein
VYPQNTPLEPGQSCLLKDFEALGRGTRFLAQICPLVERSQFFSEFNRDDIMLAAEYMTIYRAQPGQTVIQERDGGDFMLFVVEGTVDVVKTDAAGGRRHLTSVGPGMTVGEMSMIDGEPRFASCIAKDTVTFGALARDDVARIILERPSLGAKLLIRLVTMLSQRLRHTSAQLLQAVR